MTIGTEPEPQIPDLIQAIEQDDVKAVKGLLDNGADYNAEDDVGRNALDAAVARGNLDIVRLILDAGADADGGYPEKMITPLMSAACYNEMEIARLLLEHHADVNAKTEHNWTAVMYCAKEDEKADLLRLLIVNGADISPRDPRNGKNALDVAEFWEQAEITHVLKEAPEIQRRIGQHRRVAERQEQLKLRAGRFRLKVGPAP
jgi:ankyrin repeat protein